MHIDSNQEKATRQSWPDLLPLPRARSTLPIRHEFTEGEYKRLSLGLIPQEMEDKWFIFLEEDAFSSIAAGVVSVFIWFGWVKKTRVTQ